MRSNEVVEEEKVSGVKRIVKLAAVTTLGAFIALGCSWDYPVWPKNKKSDTPLFRFVVSERYGAGYIDRQGKVVIQPQFLAFGNHGGDFFEGLANVTTKDDGDFYIDASGKHVARSNYLSTGDFSEGLATRWFRDDKKYGYIDHSGKLVIPARFDSACRQEDAPDRDFHQGGRRGAELLDRSLTVPFALSALFAPLGERLAAFLVLKDPQLRSPIRQREAKANYVGISRKDLRLRIRDLAMAALYSRSHHSTLLSDFVE